MLYYIETITKIISLMHGEEERRFMEQVSRVVISASTPDRCKPVLYPGSLGCLNVETLMFQVLTH